MPPRKRRPWTGRVYLGRDEHDQQQFHWVGRFATKRERDDAVARARIERPWEREQGSTVMTVREYVADVLGRMESGALLTKQERRFKRSSIDAARSRLRALVRAYGDRPLDVITRYEAVRWAESVPAGVVADTVVLFNRAVDEELLERNAFRGLGRRSPGRSETDPPTEEQMILLHEACSVLGDYAPRMRALVTFASYTIMRPGELFALDWERHVDLTADIVHVRERVYKGEHDLPKSNRVRTIALLPQARDAITALPERTGYVFRSKRGKQLSQPTMSGYWAQVLARAGLDFDFYLATKHYGVHHMKVKLGLPNHDIAEQAGWSEAAVEEMVKTYAHTSVGALDRIKAAAEIDALPVIRDAQRDAEST
jgi:integrase